MEKNVDAELNRIARLTAQMRLKESEISQIAERRSQAVNWLHEQKVPYATIAAAMGVSEISVYKILRAKQGLLRKKKEDA